VCSALVVVGVMLWVGCGGRTELGGLCEHGWNPAKQSKEVSGA